MSKKYKTELSGVKFTSSFKGYGIGIKPKIFVLPDVHRDLIEDLDLQYLLIKGGRGGFKTTSIICAFIEYAYAYRDCAFLFTREIAKSIDDSVYSVVVDLIKQAGSGICQETGMAYCAGDWLIQKKAITNKKTNVRFIFSGLRSTGGKTAMSQINKLKGLHKLRMVMLEEGQDLTEESLNTLLPTANRKGIVKLYNEQVRDDEIQYARFFGAMNPNKEIDPVVAKFKPYVDAGIAKIAHINMMDIAKLQPELRDDQLINQMNLERNEYYFDHIWKGAPFHKFAGLPFSDHKFERAASGLICHSAWLDPSFKGGDYTAICFLGEINGRAYAWGSAFKQAWNMAPTIDKIAALIKKYTPLRFYYEDNSLGTVPRSEFAAYGLKAQACTTLINKEDKIYKASAFTKKLITFATNHSNSIWLQQVKDYSDEAEHDDAPDSFASLIKQSGILKDKVKF